MATEPEDVPLTSTEEVFLRAYARAALTVTRALETDLIAREGMPLNEYFTLMHLSEAPERRLRMSELAETAALSLSGMTRIIGHLAAQGFVRRERSADDGRGWNAVLTDAGLDRLRRAWASHLTSVRRRIFDHLTDSDLRGLSTALQQIAAASAASPPVAGVADVGVAGAGNRRGGAGLPSRRR